MASFGIPDLDPSLEADLAIGMQGVEELLREHIKGDYPLVEETSRDLVAAGGKRSPLIASVFAFFLLAFAGIPLTSGFIGKFSIFSAAYESGSTWILVSGVLSSAIAAFFYIRVIVLMFFKDPVEDGTSVVIPSALTTTTIAVTSVITVALGVFPAPLLNFIESSAFFIR